MPDTPDWQKYLPGSERYALSDLGELAARLGSPLRYDRRGEVLWFDQFDHGLAPWSSSVIGTGASVKLIVSNTFMGNYAALLTAGSDVLRQAQLSKNIQQATFGKWGVEVAFALTSNFETFTVTLAVYSGDTLYAPGFRISDTDSELQIRPTGLGWDKVVSVSSLQTGPPTYLRVKVVYDLVTAKYDYIKLGPDEYDLSDVALDSSASAGVAGFRCVVELVGRSGENDTCQVGHVIFTANEP